MKRGHVTSVCWLSEKVFSLKWELRISVIVISGYQDACWSDAFRAHCLVRHEVWQYSDALSPAVYSELFTSSRPVSFLPGAWASSVAFSTAKLVSVPQRRNLTPTLIYTLSDPCILFTSAHLFIAYPCFVLSLMFIAVFCFVFSTSSVFDVGFFPFPIFSYYLQILEWMWTHESASVENN